MVVKSFINQRELQDLLDSDDELPNSYRDAADIPAYLDDNRFNPVHVIQKQFKKNQTKARSKRSKTKSTDHTKQIQQSTSVPNEPSVGGTVEFLNPWHSVACLSSKQSKEEPVVFKKTIPPAASLFSQESIHESTEFKDPLQLETSITSQQSNIQSVEYMDPLQSEESITIQQSDNKLKETIQPEPRFSNKKTDDAIFYESVEFISSNETPSIPHNVQSDDSTLECTNLSKKCDNSSELSSYTTLSKQDNKHKKDNHVLVNRGVLSGQDLLCIRSLETSGNNSTLIWFINYLLCKDLRSPYKSPISCLVGDYSCDVNNACAANLGQNMRDYTFQIVVQCK